MARFDPTGRPRRELPRGWYDAKQLSPSIGLGNDDQAALADAVGTVEALGGGGLLIPSIVHIGSDLDVPRSVILSGVGAATSQIKSDGTQRRVNVTGVPADSVDFDGDLYNVQGLTFDNVSLDFGPNVGDTPRGCRAIFCQFVHSDRGIYFEGANSGSFSGVGASHCKFRLCDVGVYFHGAGPAHFVTDCILDECAVASILVDGVVADGISLFIANCYGDHCRRFLKCVAPMVDGGIYVTNCGIELIGTDTGGSAYGDGYWIENDGGNIFCDGLNGAFGAHSTALFWNKSGNLYIKRGRIVVSPNEVVRIDGGNVVVDQSEIFSALRLFGDSSVAFAHASSSGGVVVAPRTGYRGRIADLTTLTNASPAQDINAGWPYDGNDRVWECDVVVSALGTANALRVFLADGAHNVFVDLTFPLILGGGRLRVVNRRGVDLTASITYCPTASAAVANAAGATPTAAEFNAAVARLNLEGIFLRATIADNTTIANQKNLQFTTLAPGATTASTMTVSNIVEQIGGPHVTGI